MLFPNLLCLLLFDFIHWRHCCSIYEGRSWDNQIRISMECLTFIYVLHPSNFAFRHFHIIPSKPLSNKQSNSHLAYKPSHRPCCVRWIQSLHFPTPKTPSFWPRESGSNNTASRDQQIYGNNRRTSNDHIVWWRSPAGAGISSDTLDKRNCAETKTKTANLSSITVKFNLISFLRATSCPPPGHAISLDG